jgi:hypothetical protein
MNDESIADTIAAIISPTSADIPDELPNEDGTYPANTPAQNNTPVFRMDIHGVAIFTFWESKHIYRVWHHTKGLYRIAIYDAEGNEYYNTLAPGSESGHTTFVGEAATALNSAGVDGFIKLTNTIGTELREITRWITEVPIGQNETRRIEQLKYDLQHAQTEADRLRDADRRCRNIVSTLNSKVGRKLAPVLLRLFWHYQNAKQTNRLNAEGMVRIVIQSDAEHGMAPETGMNRDTFSDHMQTCWGLGWIDIAYVREPTEHNRVNKKTGEVERVVSNLKKPYIKCLFETEEDVITALNTTTADMEKDARMKNIEYKRQMRTKEKAHHMVKESKVTPITMVCAVCFGELPGETQVGGNDASSLCDECRADAAHRNTSAEKFRTDITGEVLSIDRVPPADRAPDPLESISPVYIVRKNSALVIDTPDPADAGEPLAIASVVRWREHWQRVAIPVREATFRRLRERSAS